VARNWLRDIRKGGTIKANSVKVKIDRESKKKGVKGGVT